MSQILSAPNPRSKFSEKIISFFVFSSEINFGVSLKYFFPK